MRLTNIAERTNDHEPQRQKEDPRRRVKRSHNSSNNREEPNKSDTSYYSLTDQPTTFWFNNYDRSFNDADQTITRGELQESMSDLQNLLSV